MAIRTGMQTLVDRLRALTGAGTAEYNAGTITYWSDNHLQDALDGNATRIGSLQLTWEPEVVGGGTIEYYSAVAGWKDFEGAESGTTQWVIRDSVGGIIGTANYTADYRTGRIRFTADQEGSAYYLTGYTYDIHAAAADLWDERLTNFTSYYDCRSENQTLSRSQVYDHATQQALKMRQRSGQNKPGGGDLQPGLFVRTDIRGNYYE